MKLWSPKEQHLRKHIRTPEITCTAYIFLRHYLWSRDRLDISTHSKIPTKVLIVLLLPRINCLIIQFNLGKRSINKKSKRCTHTAVYLSTHRVDLLCVYTQPCVYAAIDLTLDITGTRSCRSSSACSTRVYPGVLEYFPVLPGAPAGTKFSTAVLYLLNLVLQSSRDHVSTFHPSWGCKRYTRVRYRPGG
jgi:hypothetical protein